MLVLLAAQGAAFLPTTASSTVSTRPTSRPTVLRMGGFGGPVKSRTPKKKGKGKKRGAKRGPEPNPSSKPAAAALAKDREPAAQSAVTAEQARAAHMEAVRQAVERQAQSIASGLEQQGFAVVENFMSGAAVATMGCGRSTSCQRRRLGFHSRSSRMGGGGDGGRMRTGTVHPPAR